MKKSWLLLFLMLILLNVGLVTSVYAADVVDVSPITDQILCLTFSEGHIDYYSLGETWSNKSNRIYYSPLNTAQATTANNYSITCDEDATWGAVVPTSIGRKAKGKDYNVPDVVPEYILEHQVYLQLPKAMKSGKTYTISLSSLADNMKDYTFCFDEKTIRSETIHVNQVGFAQAAQKHAYLSQWMGDKNGLALTGWEGKSFKVLRYDDKSVVYSGTIHFRADSAQRETRDPNNNAFGPILNPTYADIADCDFSSLNQTGEFVVSVPGMGCSFPFEIKNDVTRDAFYVGMKGLYYQRAGIVKETGDGKIMPRDHHPDDAPYHYYSPEKTGNDVVSISPNGKPIKGVWGWYHDAADWDEVSYHSLVPLELMSLYELYPDRFYDGEVGNRYKLNANDPQWIDEGNNGIPDILDEAAWLTNYYRRAKYAIMNQYGGTGGVPGYVGRDSTGQFVGGMAPSWLDDRPCVVTGEWATSTMAYSAMAGWYSYCLKLAGITSVNVDGVNLTPDDYKQEAIDAYNWANNHNFNDDIGLKTLAALNLYKLTGIASYQDVALSTFQSDSRAGGYAYEGTEIPPGFMVAASVANLPSSVNISANFKTICSNFIKTKADFLCDRENASGMRYSEDLAQFQLGLLGTPRIYNAAVAYKTFGIQKYLDTAQNTVSYVNGGNQTNTDFMTGLGKRRLRGVCHIDSWMLNDYNSKVYDWEPLEGLTTYFGSNTSWVWSGPVNELWAADSSYPDWRNRPRAEANYGDRESINGAEFTIEQNNLPWVFSAAFLKAVYDPYSNARAFNQRPTVSLNLTDEQNVDMYKPLTLSANTSSDTAVVKYYYEWHYIGQSTDKENQFRFNWDIGQSNLMIGDHALITAIAYDNKGLISSPSEDGDKTIILSEIPSAKVNAINYDNVTGVVEINGNVPGKNATNVILKVTDEKSNAIIYMKQIKLDSSNTFDFQFILPTQNQSAAYCINLGGDVLTSVGTVYSTPKNNVGLWIKDSDNLVTARVTNSGSSNVDSLIIVAVYDANRKLQEIHTMPFKASVGSDASKTVTLNKPKNANDTVEVYLWNGLNRMYPITKKVHD